MPTIIDSNYLWFGKDIRLSCGYLMLLFYTIFFTVTLKGCAVKPVAFTSSDPDFAVNADGIIITVRGLVITTKRFYVLVQDESGLDWRVDIMLSCKDEVKLQSVFLNHKPYDLYQKHK